MTIITNANREILLPSENLKAQYDGKKEFYILEGVTQQSPELILGNLSRPLDLLKDQQSSNNKANGTSCTTYGFFSTSRSTDKVVTNTTKMQNTSL